MVICEIKVIGEIIFRLTPHLFKDPSIRDIKEKYSTEIIYIIRRETNELTFPSQPKGKFLGL